jgi:hypothetical protein
MTSIGVIYKKMEGSTRAGIKAPVLTNWTSHDVESWLTVYTAAVNATNVVDTFCSRL